MDADERGQIENFHYRERRAVLGHQEVLVPLRFQSMVKDKRLAKVLAKLGELPSLSRV